MFKVGDKVICVNADTMFVGALSENKIYTIESVYDDCLYFVNSSIGWRQTRFEKLPDLPADDSPIIEGYNSLHTY